MTTAGEPSGRRIPWANQLDGNIREVVDVARRDRDVAGYGDAGDLRVRRLNDSADALAIVPPGGRERCSTIEIQYPVAEQVLQCPIKSSIELSSSLAVQKILDARTQLHDRNGSSDELVSPLQAGPRPHAERRHDLHKLRNDVRIKDDHVVASGS